MDDTAECIPATRITELVLSIHTPVLAMDGDSLRSRIHQHPWYVLKQVLIDEIEHPHGNYDGDERVIKYKSLDFSTMPPIVLGAKFSGGRYELVDGMHRMLAMETTGESVIHAYTPVNL